VRTKDTATGGVANKKTTYHVDIHGETWTFRNGEIISVAALRWGKWLDGFVAAQRRWQIVIFLFALVVVVAWRGISLCFFVHSFLRIPPTILGTFGSARIRRIFGTGGQKPLKGGFGLDFGILWTLFFAQI
jgi:hypothetical protein